MKSDKQLKRLQEIHVREALCEEVFTSWISEQGAEGVLVTLGDLLWWLDGIASCRWGCRGGDHEEEHLIGRISANASAAFLLIKRGYIDSASGVFRQLAETTNLLHLFTYSSKDHQEWRRLEEGVRKDRYNAFNVRLKLEELDIEPAMGRDAYQVLSKYGIHPGPGSEPRTHDSSEKPTVGTAYRPAVGFFFTVAVANAVVEALIFGSDLVPQVNMKLEALNAAVAANEELRRIDLDSLKMESALVFQSPSIAMTVETHEDNP